MLVVLSCGGDDDSSGVNCPTFPAEGVLRTVEIEGNCGPIEDGPTNNANTQVPGCISSAATRNCIREGSVTCDDGFHREWWLDGASGRWTGEALITDRLSGCSSRYAVTIEQR